MAALSTYLIWGVLPLYWNLLARAEANEILAHRIIWSFFFMVVVLMVTKRWQSFKEDCRALWQNKKRGAILLLAAFTISLNWLTYIWAVNHGHVIDTSIGYYINPLMSVLFGIVFFRERISGLKKISLLLAAIGTAPFHESQRHESHAARQRRIRFRPVEPVSRAILVAGRSSVGPYENREHDGRDHEQRDAAPHARTPKFVECHKGEHDKQPNRPHHRIGCLIQNAHGLPP